MDGMDLTRRVFQLLVHSVHKVHGARGLGFLPQNQPLFLGGKNSPETAVWRFPVLPARFYGIYAGRARVYAL